MSETKRRAKKKPPFPFETAAPMSRQTRVTLTKDVSSRYRKLVPRPQAGLAAKSSRTPLPLDPANFPEPRETPKPPRRRAGSDQIGGGPFEAVKNLLHRQLPEIGRQLRETQDLLRNTAEQIMILLEDWADREEAQAARPLITALFEKMSFQDLAGQRLAKVENFLKALGESVPPPVSTGRLRPRRPNLFSKTNPAANFENKPVRPCQPKASEKSALKGPQAAGDGLGQDEVEALLADLFRQESS